MVLLVLHMPRVFSLKLRIAHYALLLRLVMVSRIVLADSLELWISLRRALTAQEMSGSPTVLQTPPRPGLKLLMIPWTSLIAILTARSTPQSLRIRGR